MEKNIFYISKYAKSPEQGGATRQYLYCKYFAKNNNKAILISSNSCGGQDLKITGSYIRNEVDKNFTHVILKGRPIKLGFSLKRITSWLAFEYRLYKYFKNKPLNKKDIVIVSSLSLLTFATGVYLKKKYGITLVVEVRDIWPQVLVDFKTISKKNPVYFLLSKIEKKGYKKADLIVGTMKNLPEYLDQINLKLKEKFVYMPMGFDSEVIKTKERNKSEKFIVGYSGTIGRANKVDLILETAELLKGYNNIEFRLLGDGPLKEKFKSIYGHCENIVFYDKVKKKEVVNFLIDCDILVNPWEDNTIYKYGISPNKWIDYMQAAKPIIVPYNGYRNIIDEAQCGEFIETNNPELFAETILKYSKKTNIELENIGANGKKYLLSNLTYNILSKKYLKHMFNVQINS